MVHKPEFVTIDNEIEIASNTHQDMHPTYVLPLFSSLSQDLHDVLHSLMGYDEELARVVNMSLVAKTALPGALVAAPSTCAWWYCKCYTHVMFDSELSR